MREQNGFWAALVIILRATVIIICISLWLLVGISSSTQEMQSLNLAQPADLRVSKPSNNSIPLSEWENIYEWNVTSTETHVNETIVAHKVFVYENVSLTLKNCTLLINSSLGFIGKIVVMGTLELHECTTIRAVNDSFGYRFHLYTTSIFDVHNSTIRDVGRDSNVARDRGVHLNGKQAVFRSSTIINCWDGLVVVTNNSVIIDSCKIIDIELAAVRIEGVGGNTILKNSVLEGNSYGVQFEWGSGNSSVHDCIIASDNYGIGLFHTWEYYWNNEVGNFSGGNSISGNSITCNETGLILDYSDNNTISENWITSNGTGIDLSISFNNTISENEIQSKLTGIKLQFSDSNLIAENQIETSGYGFGILLEPGSQRNMLARNSIRFSRVGIGLRAASPNTLLENQIQNTSQAAILIDVCPYGLTIFSNELAPSSGVAMKISSSDLVNITNNVVILSSADEPAFYLDEAENCSFTANQISTQGLLFHLVDSSNMRFKENSATSPSANFLFADNLSKNISFTLFDAVNGSSLYPRSTLIIAPPHTIAPEIASMTLYVEEFLLSSANQSNLELILDAFEVGGGNFTIVIVIMFFNGTEVHWPFSLFIYGRPILIPQRTVTYATKSNLSWNSLIPMFLGLICLKGRILKKCRK